MSQILRNSIELLKYWSTWGVRSHCVDNREVYEAIVLRIGRKHFHGYAHYSHLSPARIEQIRVMDHLWLVISPSLLSFWSTPSQLHWYQQCVPIYHVPKSMSWHMAVVVKTEMTHCFHGFEHRAHLTPAKIVFLCHESLTAIYEHLFMYVCLIISRSLLKCLQT